MYLSFDVGTTSVKTALFDRRGKLLAKDIQNYSLDTPRVDWYEVESETYWHAVRRGFRQTIARSGVDPNSIRSICGCSQGETVLFLDDKDRSVRPAIVWIDNRARQEAEQLKARISGEEFYRTTGCVEIEPTWSVLKIAWLKKHETENFRRIAKIMLVEDYIGYCLTGRFLSTPTLMHSTGLFDILNGKYWSKTVSPLEIEDRLPSIVEVGSKVGRIKPSLANELGLSRDTMVVKGAMDQTLSAVGAGNIVPGVVTETTGTALAIGVTAEAVQPIHANSLAYQPHAVPGKYLILPYAQTSGVLYKWFRDVFATAEIQAAGGLEEAYEELNRLARDAPAGCHGLMLLPFFAGAYIPENDMYAKGVWYGITLKHGKGDFARSIQESVGFMLRRILELIQAAKIEMEEVRSMGGAARSDLWLQIKADICGLPMVRMLEEETSVLGCAILSAVAVGEYGNIAEAVAAMVKTGQGFAPDRNHRQLYDRCFEQYRELYETLRPLFRKYA
jgi:sugar (pentulose or hexulose) kinase